MDINSIWVIRYDKSMHCFYEYNAGKLQKHLGKKIDQESDGLKQIISVSILLILISNVSVSWVRRTLLKIHTKSYSDCLQGPSWLRNSVILCFHELIVTISNP